MASNPTDDHALVLGSNDSALITPHGATMRVRGGGIGARATLARITGTDRRYRFAREFCTATRTLSRSGRSGTITWDLLGRGVYAYTNWCISSSQSRTGYALCRHRLKTDPLSPVEN